MDPERELIVDIGSASIGACLAETHRKGKPTLVKVIRVPVKPAAKEAPADLKSRVEETLKALFAEFHKAAKPKRIRIVLASPWYESHVHSIVSKSERPIHISHGTIARAVRSPREKTPATAGQGKEKLESVVTQIYVNGYQTTLARAVDGTTMQVELYESTADQSLTHAIREIARGVLPGAKLTFHSFPLVTFSVLRALRDEEAFTFIDIGGEVTDLAIVHADGLRFLASFPRGTRALTEDVGKPGEARETGAPTRLSLYARGELSVEEASALKPAFDKAAASWNAELHKAFDVAVSETPIPRATFITADQEELQWFQKVLESAQGEFPTRIIPVTPAFFQSAIELGEDATYDAFLSLEAIFFHIEKKELLEVS
ncbi:MAG: cell division protein FtsA [Patescibacteria group bacterium]